MLYSPIAISDGGRWIAFAYEYLPVSGQNGDVGPRIYLHNRETGSTRFVATGDYPAHSGTGRYLTFVSFEPLVEDDRNNIADVYFLDINLAVDVFERISVNTAGEEASMQDIESAPDVTDDGQYVVFSSNGGLVSSRTAGVFHIYLRNRATGTTTLLSRNANGVPANGDSVMPVIAGDGRCVAFSSQASDLVDGDTNGTSDVFVFDRTAPAVASMDYIYHMPVIGGRRR
jgi:Tol biopolymer transport system component